MDASRSEAKTSSMGKCFSRKGAKDRKGKKVWGLMMKRNATEFWGKLLAAIVVIAVLIWMGLGFYHPVSHNRKKQSAALMFKELTAGLWAYKLDHGWYPINYGDEYEGGFILYRHLFGDFDQGVCVASSYQRAS